MLWFNEGITFSAAGFIAWPFSATDGTASLVLLI